ncbi:XdhC family protein [Kribbella sp. CA-253562]|uniref:XdhC family protein n=1 Tax=Kribbella sp. CA-253562 TaxID=3239942 RepID=UPI003D943379
MSATAAELAAISHAWRSGRPLALATLVKVEGSSYRRPGARLLINADSSTVGNLTGGCLDQEIVDAAHAVHRTGTARVEYDLITGQLDHLTGLQRAEHRLADDLARQHGHFPPDRDGLTGPPGTDLPIDHVVDGLLVLRDLRPVEGRLHHPALPVVLGTLGGEQAVADVRSGLGEDAPRSKLVPPPPARCAPAPGELSTRKGRVPIRIRTTSPSGCSEVR